MKKLLIITTLILSSLLYISCEKDNESKNTICYERYKSDLNSAKVQLTNNLINEDQFYILLDKAEEHYKDCLK